MANRQIKNINGNGLQQITHKIHVYCVTTIIAAFVTIGSQVAVAADVPEVEIFPVTPTDRSANDLVSDWVRPAKPTQLTGQEREAILNQVSGGNYSGTPLINNIQTQGRTPVIRQLILTVKRPWYVHRAFLSSEGASRVDARSIMRFDPAESGRAIVGVMLQKGSTYLFDYLLDGTGAGTFILESNSNAYEFPDPEGERSHVLVAFTAEQTGWTEFSLRRDSGSFDLHSVEVTLVVAPEVE